QIENRRLRHRRRPGLAKLTSVRSNRKRRFRSSLRLERRLQAPGQHPTSQRRMDRRRNKAPDTAARPIRRVPLSGAGSRLRRRRMSTGNRILFFVTAWLIVLMPFLFWWNTWFGRQLSDKQLNEYLRDEKHPRHIQHALVQIGERMARNDAKVKQSYPDLVRLA